MASKFIQQHQRKNRPQTRARSKDTATVDKGWGVTQKAGALDPFRISKRGLQHRWRDKTKFIKTFRRDEMGVITK